MCGIAGLVGFEGGFPPDVARGVLDSLYHRGPDGEGVLEDEGVWIGMRRLSVIDLRSGGQPVFNEDRTVAAFLNGEIYNYIELRSELSRLGHEFKSEVDTEVLVHLFEEQDSDFYGALSGMFAFAVWDTSRGRLLLGRDRFGKKPLFMTRVRGGMTAFASELTALKMILRGYGVEPKVSHQSIYDYLSLGVIPQPSTIFEGIQAIEPGEVVDIKRGDVKRKRHWRPTFVPKTNYGTRESQERTRDLIGRSVGLRLRSDVPIGVLLSGGVDSSVLAYEVARQASAPVKSFTVTVPGDRLDEGSLARGTARRLGLEHHELPLELAPVDDVQFIAEHFGQPFADSSAIAALAIARLARQHVTVVINGDGGDEIFGGYRRYLAARWLDWFRTTHLDRIAAGVLARIPNRARRTRLGFARRFGRGLRLSNSERWLTWTPDFLREIHKRASWRGDQNVRSTESLLDDLMDVNLSGLDLHVSTDIKVNLLSDLLVKMDMATMATSLEARSPLLDHRLAEFAFRLPDDLRVGARKTKSILRDAYRGLVPGSILRLGKRGFEVPVEKWLRHDLRELVHDTVGSRCARIKDYVDGHLVGRLLAHDQSLDENRPQLVYALLMLELWLRSNS